MNYHMTHENVKLDCFIPPTNGLKENTFGWMNKIEFTVQ